MQAPEVYADVLTEGTEGKGEDSVHLIMVG